MAPTELSNATGGEASLGAVLAVRAGRHAAFVHAAELWRAERWLHLDAEPSLNYLAAAHPALAETAGYYYGGSVCAVTSMADHAAR